MPTASRREHQQRFGGGSLAPLKESDRHAHHRVPRSPPGILHQLTPTEPPVVLGAATDTTSAALPACPDVGTEEAASVPPRGPTASEARRQTRAAEIHRLHAHGWLQKDIAAHLHCHPKTVRRTLQRTLSLSLGRGPRASKLTPYQPYLLERWNAGCHNANQLFRELQQRGFKGQRIILRSWCGRCGF